VEIGCVNFKVLLARLYGAISEAIESETAPTIAEDFEAQILEALR
jgi:hypothetical protein